MPLSCHFHFSTSSATPPLALHEIATPVADPSNRCGRFILAGIFERYEGLYAGLFTLGFGIRWIVCQSTGYSARGGVGLCWFGGGKHEFGFRAFRTTSITREIGFRVYEGADLASPRAIGHLKGSRREVDD